MTQNSSKRTALKVVFALALVGLVAAGCNKTSSSSYGSTAGTSAASGTASADMNMNPDMNMGDTGTTSAASSATSVSAGDTSHFSAPGETDVPPTSSNTTKPQTVIVNISNFAFVPSSITIHKGDTVKFVNMDSIGHTVTADNSSVSALSSALLSQGQSYSFTFNNTGTVAYHCAIHPDMHGTIVVQ